MKLAWLIDTTTYIDQNMDDKDLFVVSLSTIINDKPYKDSEFESSKLFFDMLKENGNGAKTAQPTPQDFIETYEQIQEEGYTHVIAVHPSSSLSGTYASSLSTAQSFPMEIHVIDSGTGSFPQKELVEYGRKLYDEDYSFEEIVNKLEEVKHTSELYLLPRNLQQLKNSGRVSNSKYLLSSLLHIKLLLKLENSTIDLELKSRGNKKIEAYLITHIKEIIDKGVTNIGVLHAGNEQEAHVWKERILTLNKDVNVYVEPLVPVASVHTGYGTIGIGWIQTQ
ncbi:DegV family protein [Mammaliicoccus sciuri]|uniref:DegV family protein n=2 Tax=Mammaliicoccus TaxID=2803850 RepID=A0AAJ4SFK6_MAMSC|nr:MULTISPECIES: DegV family protein [Mammaliicoccus]MBF9298753.1 DegV family protein [Staphylococcus schleiferi]MCD8895127.1 DegV family protein [Mammaliicoccus sciuri]MCD8913191.1 DegV family protein [Mammaliicoccus sciuri]MCJ0910801.1 DegV family protein [Mammaliicoccus sciuri]MCJ0914284.1 DegV family protein [Mammaliicoccus sciuri]